MLRHYDGIERRLKGLFGFSNFALVDQRRHGHNGLRKGA